MNFFEIINARSQWESLVDEYKLDDYNSTIDSLRAFIDQGAVGNRFRPNFDQAMELANTIVSYYDETLNLPSLHGEEI